MYTFMHRKHTSCFCNTCNNIQSTTEAQIVHNVLQEIHISLSQAQISWTNLYYTPDFHAYRVKEDFSIKNWKLILSLDTLLHSNEEWSSIELRRSTKLPLLHLFWGKSCLSRRYLCIASQFKCFATEQRFLR